MQAHSSRETFESLLIERGCKLERLTVSQGLDAIFAFYRNQRAEDCPVDLDGDMLLYQWGMSQGDEEDFFIFDISRQFILDGEGEDEDIWQLSLTFLYEPTEALRTIPPGNKWCPRPSTQAVAYFEGFVRESEAYRIVSERDLERVELEYFNAG